MGKGTQRGCTKMYVSLRYDFQCSEYVAILQCVVNLGNQQVDSSRWTTIRKTHILTIKEVAIPATYRSITKRHTLSTDRRLMNVFSIIFSIKSVHLSVKH